MPEQLIMKEVVSEWDIFRKCMQSIARLGGASRSAAKVAAARRNIKRAHAARRKQGIISRGKA